MSKKKKRGYYSFRKLPSEKSIMRRETEVQVWIAIDRERIDENMRFTEGGVGVYECKLINLMLGRLELL